MAVIVPDASGRELLDDLLDGIDPWYHLYVVDVVLTQATVLADLTEATWPSYVPLQVTTWTPSVTRDGRAVALADPAVWVRGAGGPPATVYGYYVTDGRTGPLKWLEKRAAGGLPMVAPSDDVEVIPRLTLRADPDPD